MQACTIGLSINEEPKLEKGKEKKGGAARGFMQSSSHVSSRDCVYHNVYHNPPFSTSAVTICSAYSMFLNFLIHSQLTAETDRGIAVIGVGVSIGGKAGIGASSNKDIFGPSRAPLLLYRALFVVYS